MIKTIEISIIIPTKNEGKILEKCLTSLRNIDFPKDSFEVIIVDRYSADNTKDIVSKFYCTLIFDDVGSHGGACNIGIRHAKGNYIAFIDGDCIVERDWLKNSYSLIKKEDVAAIGGPNITPNDDTEFAQYSGNVLTLLSKPGARYGLITNKTIDTFHNPSCNVLYKKEVLEEVQGFNEHLLTCDDEEIDFRIREKGHRIIYSPNMRVLHYRKVENFKHFFKLAYKYGIGRMQVIKLHCAMGRWYHFLALLNIFLFGSLTVLSIFIKSMVIFPFLIFSVEAIGILLMCIFLIVKTRMKNFFRYYLLIMVWLGGYGIGMFRGLWK